MKKTFWLLDVNYEVKDHQPEVWIWGIDEQEKRILIIDRNFLAYFYLLIKEGEDPQAVIERIQTRKKDFPFLVKLEPVNRKFFGRPVKAIKVVCQDPDLIARYSKVFKKIKGVEKCLEDDIRYSMRYLIDNNVTPCGWHEVEVEETENELGAQVDGVYLAKSFPQSVEKTEVPQLRILGFSMICYGREGTPKPEKNPVVIISVATNAGDEVQFVAKDSDDKPVIESFVKYVQNFDPDVLVGYGSSRQDWPYLLARSRKLGVNLSVDRAKTEPHRSVFGHMSILGRANVDFFDFAEDLPEVKVKTLENVADFLGVMKLRERELIEDVDFPTYWESPEKRPLLLKFSKENTQCVMGIAEAMLDFAIQLSNLVGLPLDHVGTAAVGFRVEWFLIRRAYEIGELIPERVERPYFPYAGAVVLQPKPGIHENIAVLDFKAMYPNIMMAHNVSPDTYVPPTEPEPPSGVNVAPEVNHRFRTEPPGFYKRVLSHLIAVRDEIRPRLKKLSPESGEYRVLDARQKAVKVITNASYGYTGWLGARWYVKPVAEATTAWGRHIIMHTIELSKKVGLEVVYGDTDSIFVKNDPEKIEKISSEIGKKLGLEIKPDKVYVRILFTEAKKRYCGLLPDGRLDIVGLEVVRGDWAEVAKNVQEGILEIILKEQKPEKAVEFTRQYVSDLRQKRVPYRDLVIWKTLTKPVEKYAVRAPHVEAARTLMREGWDLSPGDKIGYVIVAGPGRLYEKAKPYVLSSYDEVDIEYYVSKQVVPAASRILAMFGVTEDELLPSKAPKKPKTLLEFMQS
jgi:DNA polymerase I